MRTTDTDLAREWVRTDPEGILDDIRRLGFAQAVDYNMDLASSCVADGDARWWALDAASLFEAMRELLDAAEQCARDAVE